MFFYYHFKCASNCTSCNGSCTSGCNSGCTGSCASCTGCLTCNGYCNGCTGCYWCSEHLTCNFSCPGNYNGSAPSGDCESKCYRCASGCFSCNDVYSWCNWFTGSSGSCRAGDGEQCTSYV